MNIEPGVLGMLAVIVGVVVVGGLILYLVPLRLWIAAWNADPKPFVWIKTADEILDSLAAYCTRLSQLSNDSGH